MQGLKIFKKGENNSTLENIQKLKEEFLGLRAKYIAIYKTKGFEPFSDN